MQIKHFKGTRIFFILHVALLIHQDCFVASCRVSEILVDGPWLIVLKAQENTIEKIQLG